MGTCDVGDVPDVTMALWGTTWKRQWVVLGIAGRSMVKPKAAIDNPSFN